MDLASVLERISLLSLKGTAPALVRASNRTRGCCPAPLGITAYCDGGEFAEVCVFDPWESGSSAEGFRAAVAYYSVGTNARGHLCQAQGPLSAGKLH